MKLFERIKAWYEGEERTYVDGEGTKVVFLAFDKNATGQQRRLEL